jgi:hypothetical protein
MGRIGGIGISICWGLWAGRRCKGALCGVGGAWCVGAGVVWGCLRGGAVCSAGQGDVGGEGWTSRVRRAQRVCVFWVFGFA